MQIKNLPLGPLKTMAIILFVFLVAGCASDGKKTTENKEPTIDTLNVGDEIFEDISQAKKIFYSLPSPLETAVLIKNAGATYNEELLNPVSNASKYTTNKSMALNLGIYTTDLSFASLFDQTQASINYMNAAKAMADGLGILDAIDENTISRLEENVNNRDVIMDIISETFMASSSFLKENNRDAIASVVLVGGWVEGLYLATQLVGNDSIENNKLADRILEQKLSLQIVLRLLDQYKQNQDVASLIVMMDDLKKTFDKVEIKSTPIKVEKNENEDVTTLKGKTTVKASPETFEELTKKVKAIRDNFTL
jgi:hypothetical protein